MSRTYRATGINLKGTPLGEHDRLLTILTKEYGLIRAVAAGARKYRSAMSGRSGMFVVNDLLLASGRDLDRIRQAETLQSFLGLGQNLAKLTAAQYLAELALIQALSAQPQEELFLVLTEHLTRLQDAASTHVLAHLVHGMYHLLAIAGFAPQVHICCATQRPIQPEPNNPKWKAGFSVTSGGAIDLTEFAKQRDHQEAFAEVSQNYLINVRISHYVNATELSAMQELANMELSNHLLTIHDNAWLAVERLLRAYAQYHFDRSIQSAALIDNCFTVV